MAIPSTNVDLNADCKPVICGNLTIDIVSVTNLAKARNDTAPYQMSSMYGGTVSFSRSPTSIAFASPGSNNITITANCAWKATYSGSAVFSILGISANIQLSSTLVYGGNGTITIYRNTNSSPGATGTVTITYSNGAGGASTLTVTLSTTY